MYVIIYRLSTSTPGTMSNICPIGYTTRMIGNNTSDSTSNHPIRSVSYSSGSLKFGDCSAGGLTANNYLIPIFIYGIKGVM